MVKVYNLYSHPCCEQVLCISMQPDHYTQTSVQSPFNAKQTVHTLEEESHQADCYSILVQQKPREGAVLPSAAIDGSTMQPEPHLVSLEKRQNGVVAGRFMVWGSIVGVCRHHHLLVAHEVNVEWHIDGKLQDVEDKDIGSIHRAGKAANVGIIHLP